MLHFHPDRQGSDPAENAKRGIANLSIRKPTTVSTPAVSPSAPDVSPEKGKGGGEGPPVSPLSNAAFLAHVVRDVAPGAHAVICSKPGDPQSGGWHAEAATDVDRQCPADQNNYFNCSSFHNAQGGDTQARKEAFSNFHVLVLDDVGTKVDAEKVHGVTPTWRIETSSGNSQVGFRLSQPLDNLAAVKRLQDAVVAAGLCDPGASGPARWVRLPNAINGKASHRTSAQKPFHCRLTEWHPDAAYSVEELAAKLGFSLASPQPATVAGATVPAKSIQIATVGNGVFTPAPITNPVIVALRDRGLYKREISPGRHDVTCPWVNEHTNGIDGGAAYFEPSQDHPTGGFRCQHSHGENFHVGQLLKFLGVDAEQARGKPRIDVVPGEMNRIRRAAELSLAMTGGFFQAGGAIVVIRTDPTTGEISTELLSEPALAAALSDAADWYRFDVRSSKSVRIDPPVRNVQALLRAQQLDHLPVLRGLARQPFFREDGSLVERPGYDPKSGFYAAFDADRFSLPKPSEQAARLALAELRGLLSEFRFASQADQAAALCAMLTATIRPSLSVAPAFNITASTPGSGKSYLASTIVPFAGPGGAMKVSYPATADEATKTMLSTFLNTPAAVVFDDMQSQWLPFGAINRALTSDSITDRILGQSRTATASTRSLVLGTGNNIGPVQDMTRRVVTIRLHHRTATPALLSYAGRPVETVLANRPKYVSAALTIILSWLEAGAPMADVPSIASYGSWSDLCRQPLLWLGLADPASSLIEQVAHDPDQNDLGHLLKAWHATFGDRAVTVRELIEQDGDLEDALHELPVVERGVINPGKLGHYFKRHKGRVVGDLELQDAYRSDRKGWRVAIVEPDGMTA